MQSWDRRPECQNVAGKQGNDIYCTLSIFVRTVDIHRQRARGGGKDLETMTGVRAGMQEGKEA